MTNRWFAYYSLASRPLLIRGTGVTESTLPYKIVMKGCENGLIKSVVLQTPLQTRFCIPLTQKLCEYQTQPGRVKYNNKHAPVYVPPP